MVWEWSGGPPGCPEVVARPSGCHRAVGRPSRITLCGQEAFPDVREWTGVPHGCPGVVARLFRMSGCAR